MPVQSSETFKTWIWASGTWKVWEPLYLHAPFFLIWFWTRGRGFCSRYCNLVDSWYRFEHKSITVLAVQFVKVTNIIILPFVYIFICVCLYFCMWHAVVERAKEVKGRKRLIRIGIGTSKAIFVMCLFMACFGDFLVVVVQVVGCFY